MSGTNQRQIGNTLWKVADELRGAMNGNNLPCKALSIRFSCTHNVDNFIHGDITQ
jgi:hypothetical protein